MTERIWAVINDGVIANTIVADDVFANIIRPEHDDVVEITDLSPRPGINWTVEADGYRPPSPFQSWVWNGTEWEAPVPRPTETGAWVWDEDAQEWIDTSPPTE